MGYDIRRNFETADGRYEVIRQIGANALHTIADVSDNQSSTKNIVEVLRNEIRQLTDENEFLRHHVLTSMNKLQQPSLLYAMNYNR